MSIENFFDSHPADLGFADDVSWERSNGISRVRFMAGILINEGRDGIKTYGDAYAKAKKDEKEQFYIPYFANSAAIYLGTSLLSIEEMLREGEFDQATFNARLETTYSGTRRRPDIFAPPICEVIPSATYNAMIETATADKTLVSFFGRDFLALPESMRELLEGHRLIKAMRDFLLPEYAERVKLLPPPTLAV